MEPLLARQENASRKDAESQRKEAAKRLIIAKSPSFHLGNAQKDVLNLGILKKKR